MRKAYMLIELLVVSSISAILAVAITPAIKKALNKSGGTHSALVSSAVTSATAAPTKEIDDIVVVNGHTYIHSKDCTHLSHK